MKSKICRICGNKNTLELTGFEKKYWFCSNCHTAWQKTFPKTYYKKEYYKGKSSIAQKMFTPISIVLYKLRESYYSNKPIHMWIDVGAGEGNFLSNITAENKLGVEVSEAGRKMMKENGLQTLSNKQFLKAKSLEANVISFWHVLEHLDKPWFYLQAARRNIRKNGEIIVAVPNINSFEFNFFKKHWFHLAPQFHLWHYSPTSMTLLLKNNGFRAVRVDYFSPEHHLAGLIQSFINRSTSTDNALHKLLKRGTDKNKISVITIFWIIFWLSIGFPLILLIWIGASLLRKPGAFVIVAKPI